MEFRETMKALQEPDVYDGDSCDQHKPRWVGNAEGDKDGEGEIGPVLELAAWTFPPGTKVSVQEPCCPECGTTPALMSDKNEPPKWECDCDFDWKKFAEEQYS